MNELPEKLKEALTRIFAQFLADHPDIEHDALVMFAMQIIEVYDELIQED